MNSMVGFSGASAVLQNMEAGDSSGGWLPITALLEASRGLWDVLTITPDNEGKQRAQRESVEILYTRGHEVFVRGTLPADVPVVASGLQRISPGDLVEPIFSQSSAPAAAPTSPQPPSRRLSDS